MKRKAFTLIELLIVVAIIAILAVIIVINLLNARQKANYAKARSELKTISDGIALAWSDGQTGATTNWTTATTSNLSRFVNSSGTATIPQGPTKPANWPSDYTFYSSSATDFGARIQDPKSVSPAQYCGYIKGNLFTGSSSAGGGSSVTYSSCDGS